MRGRYNSDGKIEQKIEVRDDELSNAITTVQKDSLIVEKQSWLEKKYKAFYEKYGYIPEYFVPYNSKEVKDFAPTLTANSNTSPPHAGTVLITEIDKEKKSLNPRFNEKRRTIKMAKYIKKSVEIEAFQYDGDLKG